MNATIKKPATKKAATKAKAKAKKATATKKAKPRTKAKAKAKMAHSYAFPAMQGTQAGRKFYSTMIPLELVPNMFILEAELSPLERAQRELNANRIPALTNYILDNRKSFVFSSITATVKGKVEFEEVGPNLGTLHIPMSARFLVLDGQHRRAAIVEALKVAEELGEEHINLLVFVDPGLESRQQMFADLNKNAKKMAKGLTVAYDHRDPLGRLVTELSRLPKLQGKVEFEKQSLSSKSDKTLCLGWIYDTTKRLLGLKPSEEIDDETRAQATRFWEILSENCTWLFMANKQEAREESLIANKIGLESLAEALSCDLFWGEDWTVALRGLVEDTEFWSRDNKEWEGRVLQDGRINKNREARVLAANVIRKRLGLPLNQDAEKGYAAAQVARRIEAKKKA